MDQVKDYDLRLSRQFLLDASTAGGLISAGSAAPLAAPAALVTGKASASSTRDMTGSAVVHTEPVVASSAVVDRPAGEPVETITWLHLSDLHFRNGTSYDENIVLGALLKDLAERMQKDGLRPDFIIVTGDIAHGGQAAEYRLAARFFDDLLRITGLGKDRLFLVPGNHDLDRSLITRGARAIASSLNDRKSVNEVLGTVADRKLLLARFQGYKAFLKKHLAGHLTFDDRRYFYVKTFEVAGRVVSVLGLNSAWTSSSDEDRNRLLVGERQVRDALAEAGTERALCLALVHHPFDWLRDFDRADAEALLRGRCQFILHGHMHNVGLLQGRDPDTECVMIAAGACYETREYPNSYNLVRLDLAAAQGTVHLRTYSDRGGGFWAKDTTSYRNVPDGVWTFALPASITDLPRRPVTVNGQRPYRWPSQWKDPRPSRPPGIEAWRKQAELRFNPFGPEQAENDPLLLRLVVEPPGWKLMTALEPALLWGDEGSGRTASRLLLEHTCRTRRLDHKGSHEQPVDTFPVNLVLQPEEGCEHSEKGCWRALTWALTQALLGFLVHNPSAWSATPVEQQLALGRLIGMHRDWLGNIKNYLRQASGGSPAVRDLAKHLEKTSNSTRPPAWDDTGELLLLVERARLFPFQQTFVLVEAQDGMSSHMQANTARDLDTLLRMAPLMASRAVYLKLFIPATVRSQLQNHALCVGCALEWGEPALWQMLDFRVRQAGAPAFNTLFRRWPQGIDPARMLVRAALQDAGPPRQMIRLGQALLARHVRRDSSDPRLFWSDLKAVLDGKDVP